MNKIDRPTAFDDEAALIALSENESLASFNHLQPHVVAIRLGYQSYIAANGDASIIAPTVLPAAIETYLRAHYTSPPKDLPHIATLRADNAGRTCPMCGSEKCGTLDHIFPKAEFASFAIFSANLVPTCDCNMRRENAVTGQAAGQRILHPYFDAILSQRLVSAHYDDLGALPKISIKVVLAPTDPLYDAVCFHTDAVVRRTHIEKWIATRWASLIRKPASRIRALQSIPVDRGELVRILQSEQAFVDEDKGSKNCWESMFVSGLLDDHVVDWLYTELSRPGRAPDAPLL